MTNEEFDEIVRGMWDRIIDGCDEPQNMFDDLCAQIDDKFCDVCKTPYVRIYWHSDSDSDPDNVADEMLDLGQRFDIECYAVIESVEVDATIVAALTHLKDKGFDD